MAGFTFKLEGLENALRRIDTYAEKVQNLARAEIIGMAYEIEDEAKLNCPVDLGALRESIRAEEDPKELKANLFVTANYAAYVEFGTGTGVNVPTYGEGLEGIEAYALTFKGKGIRQRNYHARPFFFPAVQQKGLELIPRLRDILNEAAG